MARHTAATKFIDREALPQNPRIQWKIIAKNPQRGRVRARCGWKNLRIRQSYMASKCPDTHLPKRVLRFARGRPRRGRATGACKRRRRERETRPSPQTIVCECKVSTTRPHAARTPRIFGLSAVLATTSLECLSSCGCVCGRIHSVIRSLETRAWNVFYYTYTCTAKRDDPNANAPAERRVVPDV